jgi:hypothetical protein
MTKRKKPIAQNQAGAMKRLYENSVKLTNPGPVWLRNIVISRCYGLQKTTAGNHRTRKKQVFREKGS